MDPRERAVDLVRQLLEIYSGGEAEADEDAMIETKFNESLKELSRLLPDPAFNELIRWPSQHPRLAHLDPAELSEKIVELAMEYRPSLWRGFTADHVRAALAAGADPNERLGNIRNTALHSVPWGDSSSVEAVRLLIEAGGDVEAVNESGWTPMWVAVRYGHRDETAALLEAGADPWRVVLGGRSAGRIALDGPLADLFEDLPGAPVLSEEGRRLQAEADGLIEGFYWLRDPQSIMAMPQPWARTLLAVHEFFCAAFVKGPDEDEVIRRMGAESSACPLWTPDEAAAAMGAFEPNPGESWLWVGTPPSGGVMIFHADGILPRDERLCRRVTTPGGLLTSVFNYGEVGVDIWRDGAKVGWPSPFHDPWPGCPDEAWRCRFGDHAHDSYDLQRSLALMTILTDVRVEPEWFVTAPKRAVRLSEPPL